MCMELTVIYIYIYHLKNAQNGKHSNRERCPIERAIILRMYIEETITGCLLTARLSNMEALL